MRDWSPAIEILCATGLKLRTIRKILLTIQNILKWYLLAIYTTSEIVPYHYDENRRAKLTITAPKINEAIKSSLTKKEQTQHGRSESVIVWPGPTLTDGRCTPMVGNKCIYHNLMLVDIRTPRRTAIATKVNIAALIRPVLSVLKLRRPIAKPPRTTVNWSHDRKVRSLAKNTRRLAEYVLPLPLGSTRTGSAILDPGH